MAVRVPEGDGDTCGLDPNNATSYRRCGDGYDDLEGHGTHVAGTIAGSINTALNPSSSSSKFNGVAPGAKLFFTDIAHASSVDGSLDPPSDLYHGLFPDPYTAGVRIHSNSWGGAGIPEAVDYYTTDLEIDRFSYEAQDFLVLIAAGNEGNVRLGETVSSPGLAKNGLTIGASESSLEGMRYNARFANPNGPTCDSTSETRTRQADMRQTRTRDRGTRGEQSMRVAGQDRTCVCACGGVCVCVCLCVCAFVCDGVA